MFTAFAQLSEDAVDRWVDLNMAAALASIHQAQVKLDEANTQAAVAALRNQLPDSDEERLFRVLPDLKHANDQQACWAGRTLYQAVQTMNEPDRSYLVRLLVAN